MFCVLATAESRVKILPEGCIQAPGGLAAVCFNALILLLLKYQVLISKQSDNLFGCCNHNWHFTRQYNSAKHVKHISINHTRCKNITRHWNALKSLYVKIINALNFEVTWIITRAQLCMH